MGTYPCRMPEPKTLLSLELSQATALVQCMARHSHDTLQVVVVEAGVGVFDIGGRGHNAAAGDVALIPPGEPHAVRSCGDAGWTVRVLWVPAATLPWASQNEATDGGTRPATAPPSFREPVVRDKGLARRFTRLHSLWQGGSGASALERESALAAALTAVTSRRATGGSGADGGGPARLPRLLSRRIREARDYIEAHCAEDVPLERLARMAGLSVFHFSRVFREETGLPPHAWQNQARIARAKALLFGGVPAARVAAETGFADQAHLSRNFKLLVGVTPRQFLKGGSLVVA